MPSLLRKRSPVLPFVLLAWALAGLVGSPRAATADPANGANAAIAPAAPAEASSPVPMIERFHAGLLEIMKEAKTLGFEGRVEKLGPLMGRTFDLDFMASKTVGRHWSTLSPEDKQRWIETFTRFTTANYAGRFKGYSGEKFVTLGTEDAGHDTRLVRTRIEVPNDEPVELDYRVMQEKGGAWRVIDVYLNGKVSELTLRRSEYASALKRDGFDQLCDSVETKIAELKSKGRSDG
ncbi:MAG: ABC transporter substrate-binding protein [Myxococcota bacterium]